MGLMFHSLLKLYFGNQQRLRDLHQIRNQLRLALFLQDFHRDSITEKLKIKFSLYLKFLRSRQAFFSAITTPDYQYLSANIKREKFPSSRLPSRTFCYPSTIFSFPKSLSFNDIKPIRKEASAKYRTANGVSCLAIIESKKAKFYQAKQYKCS